MKEFLPIKMFEVFGDYRRQRQNKSVEKDWADLAALRKELKNSRKIFATKALRHKGYINYSFFVPWCLSGRMEKVLPQKTQNLQLRN
jgi:hypothetical protein